MQTVSGKDRKVEIPGYELTTARIFYYFPDFPSLIQEFLWQDYDIRPEYLVLNRFLEYWSCNIEGRLHSVEVARRDLVGRTIFQPVNDVYYLQ
jgi:uncharacterized protein Usg